MKYIVDVVNVSKWYAKTEVIKKATFSIGVGTVCTLLGRNGSGKTTLLKIIVGLNKKIRERFNFLEKPLRKLSQVH